MKIVFYSIILSLFFLQSSCKSVISVAMGIKEPAYETDQSLLKYMDKKNISTENVYRADSTLLVPFHKCFILIPNALIFNKENSLIDIGYPGIGNVRKDSTIRCAPSLEIVMQQLCSGSNLPVLEDKNADKLLSHMYDFEGKSALENNKEDYDFLVIINWAKYLGTLNNKVENWASEIQEINNCKVKIIKLNTDPQSKWGNNWSGLNDPLFQHLKNSGS